MYALRKIFKDNVHIFFIEPTQAPCMLLGLVSGKFEKICADYAKSERQFRVNGAAVPFPTAHQRRPLFIDFVTLAHAYSVHSFQDGKNVFCQ